jgi:hypothetical protein
MGQLQSSPLSRPAANLKPALDTRAPTKQQLPTDQQSQVCCLSKPVLCMHAHDSSRLPSTQHRGPAPRRHRAQHRQQPWKP